jgi:hypothetical protein
MVELRYLWDGQRCENTVYFQRDLGWDVLSLQGLGEAIRDWWKTSMAPNVSSAVALREVYCTDLSTDVGPAIGVATELPASGELLSPSMPNNVSITVSFRTSNRGRSSRGRNYALGLVEAEVVNNEVDLTRTNLIVAAYVELIALALTLDATWVVASRFADNAPRVSGETFLIREVLVVDRVIDSQRRRLPGRGA